jgi:hypothetical protein
MREFNGIVVLLLLLFQSGCSNLSSGVGKNDTNKVEVANEKPEERCKKHHLEKDIDRLMIKAKYPAPYRAMYGNK